MSKIRSKATANRDTRMAKAILIERKHPDVSCLIDAYRHLHEREWADVSTPDISTPPHQRKLCEGCE